MTTNTDSTPRTPLAKLRRNMLQRHKLSPAPQTKQLVNPATLPDKFHKTPTQKMLEYKYHIHLEDYIFHGSLTEAAAIFSSDGIDRSTISKWRKNFREQQRKQEELKKQEADAKFFGQFEGDNHA